MRTSRKIQSVICLSLMLWASGSAVAGDMVSIRVYNDGSDDIVVTVYDLNASPPAAALSSQRISGFAWMPVTIVADALGNGHIAWTARSTDETFHRCGHRTVRVRDDEDSVRVRVLADSSCVRSAGGF